MAQADFSYTTTSKTGGAMAGGGANTQLKSWFKGQKMKTDNGDVAVIIDFDAQTMTTINHRTKTVSVSKLGDLGAKAGDAADAANVGRTAGADAGRDATAAAVAAAGRSGSGCGRADHGRMGNVGRGAAPGVSTAMIEITKDASGFSTGPIPESEFAIPAGYSQTGQR